MAYVYGNAVHRQTAVPKRKEEVQQEQPKIVSKQVRQNRNRALHMNAGYVVFLAAATVITLFICVKYLQLQSEITSRAEHITALQEELANLKEDNTTRYNAMLDSVNLEEVRDKAMNEFGMVYASPEQIIEYKSPTGNAVKQYESIPKSGVVAGADNPEK